MTKKLVHVLLTCCSYYFTEAMISMVSRRSDHGMFGQNMHIVSHSLISSNYF